MALISYPFDSQNITEADYGALVGAGLQSGIVGTPATNHFKVVAATGMNLTVTSVGGASLALVRGHACVMTANSTVTASPASPKTVVQMGKARSRRNSISSPTSGSSNVIS